MTFLESPTELILRYCNLQALEQNRLENKVINMSNSSSNDYIMAFRPIFDPITPCGITTNSPKKEVKVFESVFQT